ncbi:MAG TPA: acyltransferase family protein [Streptosporangiales bacterium]
MTATVHAPAPAAAVRDEARRDVAVDAVRVLAMCGVVLGHWLVTALVPGPGGLHVDSPLRHVPYLWPVTWMLQTLGLFFFAGGFGAAASRRAARRAGVPYGRWLGIRLKRLGYAVGVLAAFWASVLTALAVAGVSGGVLATAGELAVSPLWFLAAYVGLVALAPPLLAAIRRMGTAVVLVPLALVGADDLVRFGPEQFAAVCPAWLAATLRAFAVPCVWVVPFAVGLRWHDRTPRRAVGAAMLGGGLVAAALLVAAGYPASAVGATGAAASNLSPPTLFPVALASAQLGAFLLARPLLARLSVARVANRFALPVFLWHQTALLLVLLLGGGLLAAPGLLGTPDAGWLAVRLSWLPVFAAVLVVLCRVSRR